VVTGLGIVSGIGTDESTVWNNLMEGRTGIREIQAFDASENRVSIGAEVDMQLLAPSLKGMRRKPQDRALDQALVVADQALRQSRLIPDRPPYTAQEMPTVFGSAIGSAYSLYTGFESFFKRGVRGLRPTTVPRCMANAISAGISLHFGLTGANYVVVSACTSATNAIGNAFRLVRDGYAQRVLTGGADGFFDPFFYGVWNNLGVLSKIPEPERACRPFDSDRDGCVLGEGAAALVLESLDSACERGARIRGEILGYGETSDATHITSPSVEGQARAMRQALDDAVLDPAAIGFVNAHGTATRANDETESQSIRSALGEAADSTPVASNKSYFGHTLGASGALETVVTLLGLEAGRVPPNLNLENPDPACNIRLVDGRPMDIDSAYAMKNSFGFGGGNGVLILKRHGEAGARLC